MSLPTPAFDGDISLERTIKDRRTVRAFSDQPLATPEFSQILWAAQGITESEGYKRAAPSGGALYPIDIYAAVGKKGVKGLEQGVYRYDSPSHTISKRVDEDRRGGIASAALGQAWMAAAPVIFILTAEYSRITGKYGERGVRYALIEVGHIGQNIFLQCAALGLSAGIVGAFHDREVAEVVNASRHHEPLIAMPVGWAA